VWRHGVDPHDRTSQIDLATEIATLFKYTQHPGWVDTKETPPQDGQICIIDLFPEGLVMAMWVEERETFFAGEHYEMEKYYPIFEQINITRPGNTSIQE